MTTRRAFLVSGCALAALLAAPGANAAFPWALRAPRVTCPHTGCRYHRPGSGGAGLCALSLRSQAVYPEEELPP
ncbi:MAG: hypothetical protein JRJ84_13110 [Deltaproteobacteria bacterium]|nr:hypothetical protein [Deltaproteobacteria bacterium]